VSTLLLVPTGLERRGLPASVRAADRCVTCGVGPIVAGLAAAEALAVHKPHLCLLAGVAGTRDRGRAPLGSVVLGASVLDEAVGAGQGEAFVALADLGLPLQDQPAERLELSVPAVALDPAPAIGVVGTVAAASALAGEAAARRRAHPEVLVEEMEGYGVALACHRAGVPLTLVRAVSNVAGDRDRGNWDLPGALTALDRVLVALLDGARA
jgi:futalosine hydrolase